MHENMLLLNRNLLKNLGKKTFDQLKKQELIQKICSSYQTPQLTFLIGDRWHIWFSEVVVAPNPEIIPN
jgi:hypothetical protein